MRRLGKTLAALLAALLAYLLAAFTLGSIVLTPEDTAGDDITVYLITNGIHTDLALPLKNDTFDWTTIINPGDSYAASSDWGYAAFGWGDRGFYVETPHWRDLKISTALNAASGLGDSIIRCPSGAGPTCACAASASSSRPRGWSPSSGSTTSSPCTTAAPLLPRPPMATTTLSTPRTAITASFTPATAGSITA